MFFWLMAIPFFVIIAMFTLFKLPANDLKKPEEIQDTAMAFRMVLQHDAAAKLMEAYRADAKSTLFDLGSYNMEGDGWKAMLEGSKYLPANFISDTDNIVTYIRCLNGLREVVNCRKATGIYMITASAVPSSDAQTARWFETVGAEDLAEQLGKYAGSFPIRQNGYSLPKKPRKQEGETDEAYAVRLNAYKAEKKDYAKLKRRYYDFGDKLPRPDTTVGQVRAYPFDEGEEANERVIVRRIRSAQGNTVNYETVKVPVDIPDADGQSFDFNGEAIIFTESGLCKEGPCACTKGTDCGEGVYCLSGTCSADCGLYGFDPNRTCYTTCISDSQCPEGYSCKDSVCEDNNKSCLSANDCPSSAPYCNNGECSTTQILTCGLTSSMSLDTWKAGWANCTTCPAGQYKKYKSFEDFPDAWEGGNDSTYYPIASDLGCVDIPQINGYTTIPNAKRWIKRTGWETGPGKIWRYRVNIPCYGKDEEWDLIGPYVNWWEAQEICGKLGKTLAPNIWDLSEWYGGGCEYVRMWQIVTSTAIGTGREISDILNIGCDYDNDDDCYQLYAYTNGNWIYNDPYRSVYAVNMSKYDVEMAYRREEGLYTSNGDSTNYVLCGPTDGSYLAPLESD